MIASSWTLAFMKLAGVPSKAGPLYLGAALPLTSPCSSALMAAASLGLSRGASGCSLVDLLQFLYFLRERDPVFYFDVVDVVVLCSYQLR